MLTQPKRSDQHFTAYYEDNFLLIQFMVVEFVQIHQSTLQFKLLIQDLLNSIQSSDVIFSSLQQILGQLVGCLSQHERPSFSRWTKGSLTKLKEYCEQISRNSNHQNKRYTNLHMAVHQTWLVAIHNFELLNSLKSKPCNQREEYMQPLKRAFNSLQMRFNQVTRCIPRIMHSYWNNENVVLCLLRHRVWLSEIYGSDFLYKRFKWPVQHVELIQLLIERYQARGFDALLPMIHEVLSSIGEQKLTYDTP